MMEKGGNGNEYDDACMQALQIVLGCLLVYAGIADLSMCVFILLSSPSILTLSLLTAYFLSQCLYVLRRK